MTLKNEFIGGLWRPDQSEGMRKFLTAVSELDDQSFEIWFYRALLPWGTARGTA